MALKDSLQKGTYLKTISIQHYLTSITIGSSTVHKLIFAVIGLCLATSVSQAETPPLSISTGDHPPFTSETLSGGGIVNSYISRIAERAGLTAEFHYMPWKRVIETARNGTYQASSYWYYSEEREADFIHVGPVSHEEEVFFVLTDSGVPEWENLEDLQGLRIGATLGYTYTSEFWDLGESGILTLSPAPESLSNFRKLLSARIDMFPMSRDVGWHIIANNFTEEEQARFTTLKKPLSIHRGFLLIPRVLPEGEQLAANLQRVIDSTPPE